MAYKKIKGIIPCKVMGYTVGWIDAKCAKTGAPKTFFLKNYMNDAMRKWLDSVIKNSATIYIKCKKIDGDDEFYEFQGTNINAYLGHRNKHVKRIAERNLLEEVNKEMNPAQGSGSQKAMNGRVGLISYKHTNGKIISAMIKNVDMTSIWDEKKNDKEAKKISRKQRAKDAYLKRQENISLLDEENLEVPVPIIANDVFSQMERDAEKNLYGKKKKRGINAD